MNSLIQLFTGYWINSPYRLPGRSAGLNSSEGNFWILIGLIGPILVFPQERIFFQRNFGSEILSEVALVEQANIFYNFGVRS